MNYRDLAKRLHIRAMIQMEDEDMGLMQLASKEILDLEARLKVERERCKELEVKCKRLDEARERVNDAAAKWESAYYMAAERADKAEKERDKALNDILLMGQYAEDLQSNRTEKPKCCASCSRLQFFETPRDHFFCPDNKNCPCNGDETPDYTFCCDKYRKDD